MMVSATVGVMLANVIETDAALLLRDMVLIVLWAVPDVEQPRMPKT